MVVPASRPSTESNSQIMKTGFVQAKFYKAMNCYSSLNKDCMNDLWEKISQAHEHRWHYNVNFLFRTLKRYAEFNDYHSTLEYAPVIMAILLERVCGKNKGIEHSASYAYHTLKQFYGWAENDAMTAKNLILTNLDLNPSKAARVHFRVFGDLQITRLATNYETFIENQHNIRKEHPQVTDLEFYKIQKVIFERLYQRMDDGELLLTHYFREKFGKDCQYNIIMYCSELTDRIKELER